MLERFTENLRRQILGLFAMAGAAGNVSVDQLKILFVNVGKARAIALGGLYQTALVFSRSIENSLCGFAAGHCSSMYMNSAEGKRLRRGSELLAKCLWHADARQ